MSGKRGEEGETYLTYDTHIAPPTVLISIKHHALIQANIPLQPRTHLREHIGDPGPQPPKHILHTHGVVAKHAALAAHIDRAPSLLVRRVRDALARAQERREPGFQQRELNVLCNESDIDGGIARLDVGAALGVVGCSVDIDAEAQPSGEVSEGAFFRSTVAQEGMREETQGFECGEEVCEERGIGEDPGAVCVEGGEAAEAGEDDCAAGDGGEEVFVDEGEDGGEAGCDGCVPALVACFGEVVYEPGLDQGRAVAGAGEVEEICDEVAGVVLFEGLGDVEHEFRGEVGGVLEEGADAAEGRGHVDEEVLKL